MEARPESPGDLSLAGLIGLVRRHWVLVTLMTLAAAVAATGVAFWMTPIYRAEVVLSPSDATGSGGAMAQLMGRLGSLGSLAGLSLGSPSGMRAESIAFLKSRALTEDFILSHDLLPVLYEKDWDAQWGVWTVDAPTTLSGAVEDFNREVRSVIEDRRTGLVTLRIEWSDPELAARWANEYVAAANETIRRRAIEDAERTLNYLQEELAKTSVVGVQQGIYSLMENQINSIAAANVQKEFAFRVVDPATAAERDRFVRPLRPLVIALGAIVGFGLACLVVFLRYGKRQGDSRAQDA